MFLLSAEFRIILKIMNFTMEDEERKKSYLWRSVRERKADFHRFSDPIPAFVGCQSCTVAFGRLSGVMMVGPGDLVKRKGRR